MLKPFRPNAVAVRCRTLSGAAPAATSGRTGASTRVPAGPTALNRVAVLACYRRRQDRGAGRVRYKSGGSVAVLCAWSALPAVGRYARCGDGGFEPQQLAKATHQHRARRPASRRRRAGRGTPPTDAVPPIPSRRALAETLLSSPRQIRIARALESMVMSRQFSGRSSTTTSSSSALAMRPRDVETTNRDGRSKPSAAQPALALHLHDVARTRGPAGEEDHFPSPRARRLGDARHDAGLGLVERFPEVRDRS